MNDVEQALWDIVRSTDLCDSPSMLARMQAHIALAHEFWRDEYDPERCHHCKQGPEHPVHTRWCDYARALYRKPRNFNQKEPHA